MNCEEIETLLNQNKDTRVVVNKIRLSSFLSELLKTSTNFLPEDATILQRLYHIKNKIYECPICKMCTTPTKFESISKGYAQHCSSKCSSLNPKTKDKYKQTSIEKFGVSNASKSSQVLDIRKLNNLEKYGVDHISKIKEVRDKAKATTFKKYGTIYATQNKELREQISQSCKKAYDKKSPSQIIEIAEKRKNTCLEKFGVESASQNKELQKKQKETLFKNYGVTSPLQSKEIQEIFKQTCIEKFGTDNPFKSPEILEKIKITNIENIGVDNPFKSGKVQQEIRLSNLKKYGVEFPMQSKEIQDKTKQTCIKKYGVNNVLNIEEVQNKIKITNIEKYGVENPLQSKEIQDKCRISYCEKHGVDSPFRNKEVKEGIRLKTLARTYNTFISSDRLKGVVSPLFTLEEYKGVEETHPFQCVNCDSIFEGQLNDGRIPRCLNCFPIMYGTSMAENNIVDWVQSLGVQGIQGTKRIIPPLELDIYLPDYKLAIEFNGLYYHAESSHNRDKSYHLNKTNLCKEKGIQLIHIFEDEWIEKQEIVKSIIKNKLGIVDRKIFGRKCEIREVTSKEASNFLFENHLQKPLVTKHNYGLYYKDELVYIICIGKSRYNKQYKYELLRSCCKINTQVLGGFDKLIKHAIYELESKSIISYVDKRYFNGNGYKTWKYVGEAPPNYFYMKKYMIRESRLLYQKHKLENLFPETYDRSLTEWQNMQLNGYDRIWDCGNMIFSLS